MRRSGSSSSCLLQPRYGSTSSLTSLGCNNGAGPTPSSPTTPPRNSQRIAVVTTTRLPPYSVERYYALSEIERHAHSVVFLDEVAGGRAASAQAVNESANDDDTHSTACSSLSTGVAIGAVGRDDVAAAVSSGVVGGGVEGVEEERQEFPPYVLLYVLWRGDQDRGGQRTADGYRSDVEDFVEVIEGAVSRVLDGRRKEHGATGSSMADSSGESSPPPASQLGGGGSYEIEGYCRQRGQRWDSPDADADGRAAGTRIHVVVDRVSPSLQATRSISSLPLMPVTDPAPAATKKETEPTTVDDENDDDKAEALHAAEARVVERLAKRVANSQALRPVVDGMTIGFTSERRAAPALVEAVLSAVTHGARERRYLMKQMEQHRSRSKSSPSHIDSLTDSAASGADVGANANAPFRSGVSGWKASTSANAEGTGDAAQRSLVGVVALRPDDLTGLDERGETDAVQGIRQSLTRAEWSGSGDYLSFAERASEEWKSINDCSSYDVAREEGESVSTTMVVVFLVAVAACCLHYYGDSVLGLLQQLLSHLHTCKQK